MIPNFLVVAAHNKPEELKRLVASAYDAYHIFVIDNASLVPVEDVLRETPYLYKITVTRDDEQPPNLSRLWNIGLDQARALGHEKWNVAVVNDDVILPDRWLTKLGGILRSNGAAVAYGDQFGRNLVEPMVHRSAEQIALTDRMCGYAHITKGELGVRFDESMRWWYSDDDYDWQCRLLGGAMLVPGFAVQHTSANESTNANPELSMQAGVDRETFVAKWNRQPW